ncbi:hypothetical protein LTR85_003631 [Meristemomyces frigidus]|nr:hypothetical protein LTR85_003631 [Meristemomyces frigidus]
MCFTHQRKVWRALEAKKDKNDTWLRNVRLININQAGQGTLVNADLATKRARSANGTWRACPCGRDANPACEIWICMACEGIVSSVDVNTSRFHPANAAAAGVPPYLNSVQFRKVRRRNMKMGRVYEYVVQSDTKIVITSKAIREGHLMSRFCRFFFKLGCSAILAEYRGVLQHDLANWRRQVHVNIVNYNFKNFGIFLNAFEKLPNSSRFHVGFTEVQDDSQNFHLDEYQGHPYFAVSLIFDSKFVHTSSGMCDWIARSSKIHKANGHALRVCYNVVQADQSAGLTAMLACIDFHANQVGQMILIRCALQTKFEPPSAVADRVDVNAGLAWDDNNDEEDAALRKMFSAEHARMLEGISLVETAETEADAGMDGAYSDVEMTGAEAMGDAWAKGESEDRAEQHTLSAFGPQMPAYFLNHAGVAGVPAYVQPPAFAPYTQHTLPPTLFEQSPIPRPLRQHIEGRAEDE